MSRTLVIVRPESIYEDALIMMEFMRSGFKVKERSLRALDKLSAKQFLAGRVRHTTGRMACKHSRLPFALRKEDNIFYSPQSLGTACIKLDV